MGTTTVYGSGAQISTNVTNIATNATNISNLGGGVDANATHTKGTLETVSGLSVVEKGDASIHKTIITMANMSVASVDGTVPATDGAWGTKLLYTFPEGHINILGTHIVFPLGGIEAVTGGGAGFSDTADIEIGVGTVAAANASAFGLNTGTEENICAGVDVDLVAKASNAIESAANSTPATYDGSTSAITLNLNFRTLDDGDHGASPDALLLDGTITILWSCLGDD